LLKVKDMGYFQDIQRVVCRIPWGKIATYGDVARAAGYPGTARQVAWALRNADMQGVPWQRVLGAGGKILLPDRAGLLQRQLLECEGVLFRGTCVDMERSAFRFSPAAVRRQGKPKAKKGKLMRHEPAPQLPQGKWMVGKS
jgi:methylated-DNA-protein-cysteine methyltransferase-like protein